MFSDEILEKIFGRDDVMKVPLSYQSTMIHAVEEVLEEVKKEKDVYKRQSVRRYGFSDTFCSNFLSSRSEFFPCCTFCKSGEKNPVGYSGETAGWNHPDHAAAENTFQ